MHITVLLGGASSERDVSIVSGSRMIDALRTAGHRVTAVDPATGALSEAAERALTGSSIRTTPPSREALARLGLVTPGGGAANRDGRRSEFIPELMTLSAVRDADVVVIGLHGGQGEDGTIQAMLDAVGVPFTGSGHLASALAMDKDLSKALFRDAGVGTADWVIAPVATSVALQRLALPLIVKPVNEGSTVGLTIVKDPSQLDLAVALASRYDTEVMLERFIPGRELTVGVLGTDALPVGEIFPQHEIYDYECKYTPGMAREEFPAHLSLAETTEIQRQAVAAFRALKLRGYARIDFRMDPSGGFYCLEANTLPGMTPLSLIPQAAAAAGISFVELCERIVELAVGNRSASNVLKS